MPYKAQRRTGIMLAYPFEEKRLSKWSTPWLVQQKLDGVRCRCLIDEAGEVKLLSSEAHQITMIPHIVNQIKSLHLRSMELDGELYRHGMGFNEIVSRTSREANPHPEAEDIEYHIFDIVSSDHQLDRALDLANIPIYPNPHPNLRRILPHTVYDLTQLMALYEQFIKEGYEGFVIRNKDAPYLRKRSVWMMKFKPRKQDVYLIIGTEEEYSVHGEPKGRLGALHLVSGEPNSPSFRVGTGFTAEQREELWKVRDELKGKVASIKYQHLTEMGVPRFPVFVSIIVPGEELCGESSSGGQS